MCELGEVQSFAFMDLETTGLPQYNFGKSNITEIAIYACLRRDFLLCKNGEIPRNIHKLVLCFNPLKMIDTESSLLSGLYNDMLEPENCFNENAGNIIINFLRHLKKPICLIAHNGFNFDFPILKKSLIKINIEMPDFLVCMDSFSAIKKIDEVRISREKLKNVDNENVHGDRNDTEIRQDNIEKFLNECIENKELTINDNKDENIFKLQEEMDKKEINQQQKLNETTPKRNTKDSVQLKRSKLIKNDSIKPTNTFTTIDYHRNQDATNSKSKSKRKLIFSTSTSSTSRSSSSPYNLNGRGYYKLSSIYHRIFGEQPFDLHHAEDDVLTLQKISISYGNEFVKYADENAIKFKDISTEGFR